MVLSETRTMLMLFAILGSLCLNHTAAFAQELVSISVEAPKLVLGVSESIQLQVTGQLDDGNSIDLTTAASGTIYIDGLMDAERPVTVDPNGLATAVFERSTLILISNSNLFAGIVLIVSTNPDTDGDGIPDLDELTIGLDPNDPNDAQADDDSDQLSNVSEFILGTGINDPDSDDDGIFDGDEIVLFLDPTSGDSDGDGVSDSDEIDQGSDPTSFDPPVKPEFKLDENCVATLLTRTVQILPNGTFAIPNVPVPLGATRIRVVCERDGFTTRGHTPFAFQVPNAATVYGPVSFNDDQPIPVSIAITSPATVLTPLANGAQLTTTGTLVDGLEVDFTLADSGTFYLSSNPAIATVSEDGFVLAASSGVVIVTAMNEGVIATIQLEIQLDADVDGDGIPNDFENLNAVNPGGENLSRLPGTQVAASTFWNPRPPERVVDGLRTTSWFTQPGDAANQRTGPFVEIILDQERDIAQVRMFGNRESNGFDFLAGVFQGFDDQGIEVFNSGEFFIPAPDRDVSVAVDTNGIRRLRFAATDDISLQPGLSELELISRPGGPGLDPNNGSDGVLDFDLDGLTNLEEFNLGSSLWLQDTDADLLTDLQEFQLGSSPLLADSDGDGLLDREEIQPTIDVDNDGLVNVVDPDSDGDGLPDGVEVDLGLSPILADTNGDSLDDGFEDGDGDGITNIDEVVMGLDPANPDTDGDGIRDGEELVPGGDGIITDPRNPDTDGDGLPDGFELQFGLDPLDPSDADDDFDNDGRTNLEEFQDGTDLTNPDVTPPAVSMVTPVDGAVGFPVSDLIVVRYAEPLDPNSIGPDALLLILQDANSGPEAVDGEVMLSQDGLSLTFEPLLQLLPLSSYRVQAQGVRDLAGNSQTILFESSFDSGVVIDSTAPDVVAVSPVTNASDAPINAPFRFEFSERMDPSTLTTANITIEDQFLDVDIAGMIQVDPDGLTAAFVPDTPYAVGRDYRAVILGGRVRDRAGNTLPFHSFNFMTGFDQDFERPILIASSPAAGATNVPTNAVVVLQFDEPLVVSSVSSGLELRANGERVEGSIAVSDANRRVTFTSATALPSNAIIDVLISTDIVDLAGNPISATQLEFTTADVGDLINPVVLQTNPPSGVGGVSTQIIVEAEFSEPVNPITITDTTFTLTENTGNTKVTGAVEVLDGGLRARFTSDFLLESFAQHTIRLSNGIRDIANRSIPTTQIVFVTGAGEDLVSPSVIAVSPGDGDVNVPANPLITLLLDEEIDPFSVDSAVVELFIGPNPVPSAFSAGGQTVTLAPIDLLLSDTTYTVNMSGLADVSGNPAIPFTSSFTTAPGIDPNGPLTEMPGSSAVASSQFNFSLSASRTIDGSTSTNWCSASTDPSPSIVLTVPADTRVHEIRMTNGFQGNRTLAASFQLEDANGAILFSASDTTIAPLDDFSLAVPDVGSVRTLRVTVTSQEGTLACISELELIGVFDPPISILDTARPFVSLSSPASGASDVPLTTDITITFTEPVNQALVPANVMIVSRDNVAIDGTFAVSGADVIFTPSGPFPPGQQITYRVLPDLEDLAGNRFLFIFSRTFTTIAGVDGVSPSVLSITPGAGAIEIGRTVPVTLRFSEPLSGSTINDETFALFANGLEIPKSITRTSNNAVVTLKATLPRNSLVFVTVTDDVTDLAGNPLADFTSTFQTGDFDIDQPSIGSTRPGGGATGVRPGTTVVLYATEELDLVSVPSGVVVSENGVPVGGAALLVAGGRAIQFVPDAPFALGARVQVFADGQIRDLFGRALASFEADFTIQADPSDRIASIQGVSPSKNVADVARNLVMEVLFSEPITPSSLASGDLRLQRTAPTASVSFTRSLDRGNRLVRMIPDSPLEPNTTYAFSVFSLRTEDGGITQSTGGNLFTTSAELDSSAPTVDSLLPENGQTDVGINSTVVATFSEGINILSVDESALTVTGPSGEVTRCTVQIGNNDRSVVVVPHEPFEPGVSYIVDIDGVTDHAGNLVAPFSSQFVAGTNVDTDAPQLINARPQDDATSVPVTTAFSIEFSEPISIASLTGTGLRLSASQFGALELSFSLSSDGLQLFVLPDAPLPAGANVDLFIEGVRDLADNLMPTVRLDYATGFVSDTTGPVVTGASPPDGLVDVPTNADIMVDWDEPISTVALVDRLRLEQGGVAVPVEITVTNGNQRVRLSPTVLLDPLTPYTVVADSVEDSVGNGIASAFNNVFTTGAGVELLEPDLATSNPLDEAKSVPTNVILELLFSERVNALTATNSTIRLVRQIGGSVAGTVLFDSSGALATFIPSAPLEPFTDYDFTVSSTLEDLTGEHIASQRVDFQTGAGDDLSGPQVIVAAPPAGDTVVPTTAIVTAILDESFDDVRPGLISVELGGIPIAGTQSASGRTLRFVPDAILDSQQTYSVVVDGFFDLAGNPMVPFSSDFSTVGGNIARSTGVTYSASSFFSSSAGPDRVADGNRSNNWCTASGDTANQGSSPFVEITLPEDATVQQLRLVGATFSGNLITAGIFDLLDANRTVLHSSGEIQLTSRGDALIDVPSIGGVRFVRFTSTGDVGTIACVSEFEVIGDLETLLGVVDSIGPVFRSSIPDNGATGVSTAATISLLFDEPIDATTVDSSTFPVTQDGIPIVGTYEVVGTVVTFTPSDDFVAGQSVSYQVGADIGDVSGNTVGSTSTRSFTTVGVDLVPPSIVAVTPLDGATDIARETPVVITFSEPVRTTTTSSNSVALFANGAKLPVSIARSSTNTVVTLTGDLPAATGITLVVTSDVTDLMGNSLPDFTSSFTTVEVPSGGDTTRPTIRALRPGNGATGVANDISIVLFASEVLNPATVDAGIFFTENGVLLSGVTTLLSDGRTIRFAPDAPFADNAFVMIFGTEVLEDLEGNGLTSFSASFRVKSNPSSTTVVIESFNPNGFALFSNDAVAPRNAQLQLRFSEPLDPNTVNTDTVVVSTATLAPPFPFPTPVDPVPGSVFLSNEDRIITFIPDELLPADELIIVGSLFAPGLRSVDGDDVFLFNGFETTNTVDLTAPVIESFAPFDGQTDVPLNAVVEVEFDEPVNPVSIDPNSVELIGPGGVVAPCSVTLKNSDAAVTLTPHEPLLADANYTIVVDGVRDVAGNPAVSTFVQFQTGSQIDTDGPSITRLLPPAGATGVPTDAVVTANWNEVLQPANVFAPGGVRLVPSGQSDFPGTVTLSADRQTILFVPDAPMAASTLHSVAFGSMSNTSGFSVSTGGSFTTGAGPDNGVAPTIVATSPSDGAIDVLLSSVEINVDFDEPLDIAGLNTFVEAGGQPVPFDVELVNGANSLRIELSEALLNTNTVYSVTLSGISDLVGNTISTPLTFSFTSALDLDLSPPAIVLSTPSGSNVPANAVIGVRLSDSIDPNSVSNSSLQLSGPGGSTAGVVTLDPDGRTLFFAPAGGLQISSSYSLRISNVRNVDGLSIGSSVFVTSFSTGFTNDTDAPQVQNVTPADASTNVVLTQNVIVSINDFLDPLSIPTDAVRVFNGPTPLTGALTRSGSVFTFIPATNLDALTLYTLEVDGFTDRAGNLVVPFTSTFTTEP